MNKMVSGFIGIICMFMSCTSRDTTVDKSKLLAGDYRLFQDTPAWQLAKAVEDDDTDKIKEDISKNKSLLTFREPRFGQPLLKMAVMNKNYQSVKTLLELGADPNMQDLHYGESPLMASVDIGINGVGSDPRFVKLLLKYGGDPNAEEKDGQKHGISTPLRIACQTGDLAYIKILVNAGAKINYIDAYGGNPLYDAIINENPEIVFYLLNNGADFKRPIYTTMDGEKRYITDGLREWRFDLGSEDYKKKMQIVDFLKKNGMDYRKTEIPKEFLGDYSKEYLDKY